MLSLPSFKAWVSRKRFMNVEGIKGSIDLQVDNVFSALDKLEGRLNKFAASRGNDGEIIANEMKTIINVIAGSQIEFADNLKKAFDKIQESHASYSRKARRIEKDVTKALVEEVMKREQAMAVSYARTAQKFMESQIAYQESLKALTDSKINDRNERRTEREAQKQRAELARQQRELEEKANDAYVKSMARLKQIEQERTENANEMMIRARQQLKAAEDRKKAELKAIKDAEKAESAAIEKRKKMVKNFASYAGKILKGIVWFPVIANQTMQMFQGVGSTLKSIWDATIGQVIKVGAEVESYMVRLKVSTGTLMAAREVWKDIEKFATESVYGFEESVQSAVSLIPVLRNGREELSKWQPVIADLAAGFGLSYEEATGNFIKAYSGGIAAADLFRERGISAALGFIPGKSVSGKETADRIYEAYISNMSVFRGAAEQLAYTWSGIMNKISDQWFLFVKDIGDVGVFDKLKRALTTVLERFEELRGSGDNYKKLLQNISDLLMNAIKLVYAFFKGLINGIMSLPVIGDSIKKSIDEVSQTESQLKVQEKINKLIEERNKLQPAFGYVNKEDKQRIDSINKELDGLYAVHKAMARGIESYLVNLKDSLFYGIEEIFYNDTPEVKISTTTALNSAEKEMLIDDTRKKGLIGRQNAQIEEATKEVVDKIDDNLRKAHLGVIKYTQGEWAAFQEEVSIQADKMEAKLVEGLILAGDKDPISKANDLIGRYISSELAGKIAEYKEELRQIVDTTNAELSQLGMTDYEKQKDDLTREFSSPKWKGQSAEVQAEMDAAIGAKNALIEEQEARRKGLETLEHEQKLKSLAIPTYMSYSQKLAEITNEYEKAAYKASDLAIAEAKLKKDRAIAEFDKETIADYNEQLSDLQFQMSQFGKTDIEQKLAEINRQFRILQDPNLPEDIRKVAEQLRDMSVAAANQEQLTTFAYGWESAMKDIKNSMMTDGQAIKTFLMDVFSELRSALEDTFFKAFKGELKSASEAFESFADAILQSISRIMANQIAGNIMSGVFGMMHSGGIVGQGYSGYKKVNPLMFAGAPRFHTGGIAGLSQDEIPAILQRGELVLPRGWEKGGGSVGNVSVSIKNESGQNLKISKASTSQDVRGQVISIVIDGINRNSGGLRDMLGR